MGHKWSIDPSEVFLYICILEINHLQTEISFFKALKLKTKQDIFLFKLAKKMNIKVWTT